MRAEESRRAFSFVVAAAVCLIAVLLVPSAARVATSVAVVGQTYYLSPSGKDGNAGTSQGQAWQTITKVNSTTFGVGDRILFEGRQTFAGSMELDAADVGPVTIGSYGTGRATPSAGTGSGISITRASGVTIEDLVIVGAGAATNQIGRAHG